MISFVLICCAALTASAAPRKIERRVPPVYPELAKRMHIGGTVRISTTISTDGTVTQTKVISGNKLFAHAAESAVLKWKFAPGDAPSIENIDVDFLETN